MAGIMSNGTKCTLVPGSPALKRQRTDGQFQATQNGYQSDDDSGDDLFNGITETPPSKYLTQPTQILARSEAQFTQPTQILDPISSSPVLDESPVVLVPASSPTPTHAPIVRPRFEAQNGGRVSLMAPAGTEYRPPLQRAVHKPLPSKTSIYVDLSDDDGPRYKGGSSDDNSPSRADIKPSFGAKSSKPGAHSESQGSTGSRSFQDLMARSMFEPGGSRSKPFDLTQNSRSDAFGFLNGASTQKKVPVQSRPERAMPVQDMKIFDISDPVLRRGVERLEAALPGQYTVKERHDALEKSKGDFDSAALLLLEKPGKATYKPIPLSSSPPQMKHSIGAPLKSIAQRYMTSTQMPVNLSKSSQPGNEDTPPKKKGRRLQRGRRNPSSPAREPSSEPVSSKKVVKSVEVVEIESDLDSYDSGVGSEEEEDLELEGRVLNYLNTCTVEELAEFVNVKTEDAAVVVNSRPFKSLDRAREVAAPTKGTGKRSSKAPIGEKIVENALQMQSGYEALDVLVAECKRLGQPLTDAIRSWGHDLRTKSNEENSVLEISSFDDDDLEKDSGLGTPNSKSSQAGDVDVDDLAFTVSRSKRQTKFIDKPSIMSKDLSLKDFQRVGLNWLALLYKNELSCILADEMGCGKTCQVISFLAHLVETGINTGPHLVVVPPSTLENWLREFARFCPDIVVNPYYGPQKEREELGYYVLDNRDEINVVITTYSTSSPADGKFLRSLKANVCVFDEGHLLKNNQTKRYKDMMRIPAKFRVLLTGTPLQNNLTELAALLNFILPNVFSEHQDDLDYVFKHKATTNATSHAALLNKDRIARAKSMLTPFILQRKADSVLKLPPKTNRIEYCNLVPSQAVVYDGLREKTRQRALAREKGERVPNDDENNPVMQARKAALHPMLFRRHFTQDKLELMLPLLKKHHPSEFNGAGHHIMKEMQSLSDFYLHIWCQRYSGIAKFDTPIGSCMESGKVQSLIRLLKGFKKNKDRVLVFSQFTLTLDILEEVLQAEGIPFSRIDGATSVNDRQTIIDTYREDTSITCFLLSTGAGGTGINLEMANKVVIFDSSFNPHDDVQAEKRAHRMGQTRPVEVIRMVTRNTIEEQILALGQMKLTLDREVTSIEDAELKGESIVLKMLLEDEKKSGNGEASSSKPPESSQTGTQKKRKLVRRDRM